MSDVELYIFNYDKDKEEAAKAAKNTARRLVEKDVKLLSLIESIGQYLNSDEAAKRTKALSYLAEVLEALPPKTLTGQQRNLLCDFLVSRIADESETLPICARALLALDDLGPWETEKSVTMMTNILENTHPLSQYKLQSQRYPVLNLIDRLLAKYRKVLHELHDASQEFMSRFVSYFDAEKDPRNLMLVFSILLVPMTEWDIHSHAQELFDAVFNYFPITFRPPPNDPYGITAQDLKDRLRHCIAASADLAPYAFPALLDKLDSTSMNTKRDVLQALSSCVENYGPHTISLYSVTLWDALKFEVLQVQDDDLAQEALSGLTNIATQLSKGSTGALTVYLKPIAKEANEHLEDAPTKQSQAAAQILENISASSTASSNFIFGAVLPTLFALYGSADTTAKRRGLIEVLNGLIRANLRVYGEWRSIDTRESLVTDNSDQQTLNSLSTFSSQVLDVLLQGLHSTPIKEVSYRLVALDTLANLTKARNILNDEDVSRVISLLDDIVLNEESYGNDDVKTAAMNSLVSVAQQKPQLIIDKAFPTFMAKLPDSDRNDTVEYVGILEAFAQMSKEPKVFQTIMVRLRNKLYDAIKLQASPQFIQAVLAAMIFAVKQNPTALVGTSTECSYYEELVRPLIQMATSAISSSPLTDPGVVELIGKLSNAVIQQQNLEFQASTTGHLPYGLWGGTESELFPSFAPNASPQQVQLLLISTHLLAALRRDIEIRPEYQELLTNLKRVVQSSQTSSIVKQTAVQQISLVINKFVPRDKLSFVVDLTPSSLRESENITSANNDDFRIAFAATKGLLLRNAPVVTEMVQRLLEALSATSAGLTAARGFAMFLQPDELLTKENYCVISPLYRQKLFQLATSTITTQFPSASSAVKRNYLIALSGILRYLPYTVIEPQLSPLTPLLLQMLDLSGETDVKAAAIDILITVLVQQPEPLEEHASSVISRLLNATTADSNPPNVRSRALHCLALVPKKLKTEVVIPFRRQVVKRLTEALDDRKRAVRIEAVKCRSQWIELDEAGDDEE
ncbi:ARM repeat-containing protein [Rhizodiscina lignyota]|uniref:MMS19 nucleotide excision repair protein n=1 Tax=Rhizodiscina lignyota TaxID=1504668 RepID=A0A9P4M6Q6_9PEZI|nr:ARM repeat-containing protein [Rhizodiscina lignyota]